MKDFLNPESMNTDKPELYPSDNDIWKALQEKQFSSNPDELIKPIRALFTPLQSKISSLESDRERLLSALKDLNAFVTRLNISPVAGQAYRKQADKLITEIESKKP
jgi:hypothetical protein